MNRFLHNQWIGMLFILLPLLPRASEAANYFVTPSGGGNHSGTSSGNPWSVNDFNGSRTPTGGDSVTFTGNFTSTIAPAKGGTSNAARLVLNMPGATLNGASPRLYFNGLSFITVNGGTMGGVYDATLVAFNSNFSSPSHDITLNGWRYIGQANGIATFVFLNHCANLTVSNCYVDNVGSFVTGDSTLNHDLYITGCFARTSTDTTEQDDLIKVSDAANVTIEKCQLIGQAPANPSVKHNDIIQNYTKGGSYAGNPTNWVIRYNWFEMQQRSGSGDCSWLMLQSMGGNPALKVYGNVFFGSGTIGNNGVSVSRNNGGTYYFYNNTVVRHNNPDNNVRFLDGGTVFAENNIGFADPSVGVYGTFLQWTMGVGASDYNFWYGVYGASANGRYSGPHGSLSVNPLFANYAGNNFSLQASSPLHGRGDRSIGAEFAQGIKVGSTWPNPVLTPRNSWDIGAYNQ